MPEKHQLRLQKLALCSVTLQLLKGQHEKHKESTRLRFSSARARLGNQGTKRITPSLK